MLRITIPAVEKYDEGRQEFIYTKEQTLQLEHSLISLSKWEAKWCKPFLSKDGMSVEETIDYIKCMTVTPNVHPDVYTCITDAHIQQVSEYINAPMTATWFSENKGMGKGSQEAVTSELIYYWMIALQVPFECEKWHLNRLLTLIKVCNIKNAPPKKMSKRELMNHNRNLNARRRSQLNTRG